MYVQADKCPMKLCVRIHSSKHCLPGLHYTHYKHTMVGVPGLHYTHYKHTMAGVPGLHYTHYKHTMAGVPSW